MYNDFFEQTFFQFYFSKAQISLFTDKMAQYDQ